MIECTFEELPKAVFRLNEKIDLLLARSNKSQQFEIDNLLTIQEASEFLHLSVPTLYGYVSKSIIPVSKQGKRLYFSKMELINWIKTGRKKTISEIQNDSNIFLKSSKKK